jgi:tRNA/rRNA methyltransferase
MSRPAIPARVILVHPTLAENVGAVARAMRHFAQDDLVLVGSRALLTDPAAIATSAGSEAILQAARCVETLDAALEGSGLVVGTTARITARPDLRTEVLAAAMPDIRAHVTGNRPVTWVFGTERHGLTREQALRCDRLVRIPGEPGTCLNLAMAVNIVLHACYASQGGPEAAPAGGGWLQDFPPGLLEALEDALMARGFWRADREASKRHSLRRLASRIRLERDEARLLEAALRILVARDAASSVIAPDQQIRELPESAADAP